VLGHKPWLCIPDPTVKTIISLKTHFMRKFYTLVTGILFCLVTIKTIAQPGLSETIFSNENSGSHISFPFLNVFSELSNSEPDEKTVNSEAASDSICKADFEITPTPNAPLYKKFTALPSHTEQKRPVYICWKFGDGKDTCIQYSNTYTGTYSVIHYYQQPGIYEVCVRIVYEGGCEAKKCKAIAVEQADECRIDFERVHGDSINNPLLAYYKALPGHNNNKKPKQICWKFGDGKDTCIEYPENYTGVYAVKHEYREPGNYEVCVKTIYYGGCEAIKCKPILVSKPDECKADFEKVQLASVNYPLHTYFKALPSHNNNKKPVLICWKFGDGKDTCIQYPDNYTGQYIVNHVYREQGNYEVCVKILYQGGCESYKCKLIQTGRPDQCSADFERTPIANSDNPLVIGFKALPLHNNQKAPKVICWNFGDGKDTCVEYAQNFSGPYVVHHKYAAPGTYEVCIKILYNGGCETKKCKPIAIEKNDECKAGFERIPVTTTGNQLAVYYKALLSPANNKKPKQICWKFGDGKDTCITYTENYTDAYTVRHEYREAGNYEVCIKILYYGGCEAKKCEMIKIEGRDECRVKLFELTPAITSLVRGFYISPWSSNNKKPVTVCLNFGDGSDTCIQFDPSFPSPGFFNRHTYPAPGVYRTCVKVMFEGGCFAYECKEVVIRPSTNICGGYMTDSLLSPGTFKFKGFAVHNQNDPVINYKWIFGDGSSAAGKEVTHTYNVPGTYETCLLIKTQLGCETKICKKLLVPGDTGPVLRISPNPVVNILHVLFYSTHTEPVNIKIVNGFGVIVKSYVRNASTGANNWDFDLSLLTPGAYTLYVQSPNQLSSQLFIKN
jgi:PKD repeat protein